MQLVFASFGIMGDGGTGSPKVLLRNLLMLLFTLHSSKIEVFEVSLFLLIL